MTCYVLGFQEIDQTQVAIVGGKGAHLGELARIEGLRVPAGFCVTTEAFRLITAHAPSIDEQLDRLSRLKPNDRETISAVSAEIRRTIEGIAIPDDLAAAITRPGGTIICAANKLSSKLTISAITSARRCVMKSTDMPVSRCMSWIRARMSASAQW